jgi:acetyltransferase-like isoleucine patch superfamily enzyme
VLLAGEGRVAFEPNVTLGWPAGPGFYTGYTYIEARYPGALVTFGSGSHLNNGVVIVSEGPGIEVGERCLMGPGVHIYDSDFHSIDAARRTRDQPARAAVKIGEDVFIGSNAMILKGTTIGSGATVGAGAVVSGDVPERAIVVGNPARSLD